MLLKLLLSEEQVLGNLYNIKVTLNNQYYYSIHLLQSKTELFKDA